MRNSHIRTAAEIGDDLKETAIIRFGALGDLCICGWFLSAWAEADPQRRFCLVTKVSLAELAAGFRHVQTVIPLRGSGFGALRDLGRQLRTRDLDLIIDAHNNLRSRLLTGFGSFQTSSVLEKDTLQRLLLLAGRRMGLDVGFGSLDKTLLQRYLHLHPSLADSFQPTFDRAPLGDLRPSPGDGPLHIAMAPGARWPQKRWPEAGFLHLAQEILAQTDTVIDMFVGPDENTWFAGSHLAKSMTSSPRVTIHRNKPLIEVAHLLAACRCLIANDSGLLHLAEATGTPVVAIYGPTTREFGYYPLLPASMALEVDLPCRPCSRTGNRRCHRGDSACLESITPETVFTALLRCIGKPPSGGI